MKDMIRKTIFTLLLLFVAGSAFAQAPRVRVEWGVLGGINIPNFSTNDNWAGVKNKMGWQLGITTAVNFGAIALEPQILYVRQGLRISKDGEEILNLKSNSIDVPIFASLRLLKPVRIYAGPVFTVMNDCKQKSNDDLLNFGRIRPSVSYAVGVSVMLGRHLMIDARYNGQFRGKKDVTLPDGTQLDKLSANSLAINLGYIF